LGAVYIRQIDTFVTSHILHVSSEIDISTTSQQHWITSTHMGE